MVSMDEKVLIWYAGEKEKHLKLNSVSKIVAGQKTVNFLRQHQPEIESQSFSLIYQNGERSLDLICKDKQQADSWIFGLRALVSVNHHPRPLANLKYSRGAQSCVNSPVGHIRRKYKLGLLQDSAKFSQAMILSQQCQSNSQKLQHYKCRIEETWLVARDEASKCKAAKDVIEVLTNQINALSDKLSSGKRRDSTRSLLDDKVDICSPCIIKRELLEPVDAKMVGRRSQLSQDVVIDDRELQTGSDRVGLPNSLKDEWVDQDERGVYITFITLPTGRKGLKRVRFSRKHFSSKQAEEWWEGNQTRIYAKYNIERIVPSSKERREN